MKHRAGCGQSSCRDSARTESIPARHQKTSDSLPRVVVAHELVQRVDERVMLLEDRGVRALLEYRQLRLVHPALVISTRLGRDDVVTAAGDQHGHVDLPELAG